jgi:glycosyltransferase involved in cell wall biosynthesis
MPMIKVLLINKGPTPHYRISVYEYIARYLKKYQFEMTVVSEGAQRCSKKINVELGYIQVVLNYSSLSKLFMQMRPDVVIFWVDPQPYMFPILCLAKILKIKVIHWGHRRPMHSHKAIKSLVYNLEHWLDDAVILYSENLRRYVYKCFQSKTFVANNTLNITTYNRTHKKGTVKEKYEIDTSKNIICMGRMQRRKRIDDLLQAFRELDMGDVGLILAGPDSEGVLKNIEGKNIFKVGAVYGEDSLDLLSISDVYCLPGAIGLSIVDAFYCGLPVITENVVHGPEIMYLKDGINGFIVPKGDITQLAAKLKMLLMDDVLREEFSQAARNEIMTNGHIDRMCEGFRAALQYVCE